MKPSKMEYYIGPNKNGPEAQPFCVFAFYHFLFYLFIYFNFVMVALFPSHSIQKCVQCVRENAQHKKLHRQLRRHQISSKISKISSFHCTTTTTNPKQIPHYAKISQISSEERRFTTYTPGVPPLSLHNPPGTRSSPTFKQRF